MEIHVEYMGREGMAQSLWLDVEKQAVTDGRPCRSPQKHFYGIMHAIMPGIHNGMAESINSKIQKVKKMACGFRNVGRFQNAIMFHFGGLDLYPALPTR